MYAKDLLSRLRHGVPSAGGKEVKP